jgi:uncharacterized protein YukJ
MPARRYGVLKGRVLGAQRETGGETPHYQIHVRAGRTHFRVAVNVSAQTRPPDLLFLGDPAFRHSLTDRLPALPAGFSMLRSRPGGLALDYIRDRLFDPTQMRHLPFDLPGPDNDLSDQLEGYVNQTLAQPDADLYAFGMRWGPEPGLTDQVFRFRPGNGVHDIHMNQGNAPGHAREDGVWQDGGLILHFPAANQWVAIFLAFQSQVWRTDDRTGQARV